MAGPAKARRLGNADLAGSIAAAAHGAKSRIEAINADAIGAVAGAGDDWDPTSGTGGVGTMIDIGIGDPGKYATMGMYDPTLGKTLVGSSD